MATSDAQPPPAGPPSEAAPPTPARSWFDRIDGAVYGVEQAIVIGALLVMTVTYVLTVLRNNAVREVNTFDKLLISLSGYEDQIQAPPDVVASITTLWTPLLLGLVVFGLTLLALRTRERSGLEPGEAPPRPNWPRRLILATVITGLLAGLAPPSGRPCRASSRRSSAASWSSSTSSPPRTGRTSASARC